MLEIGERIEYIPYQIHKRHLSLLSEEHIIIIQQYVNIIYNFTIRDLTIIDLFLQNTPTIIIMLLLKNGHKYWYHRLYYRAYATLLGCSLHYLLLEC